MLFVWLYAGVLVGCGGSLSRAPEVEEAVEPSPTLMVDVRFPGGAPADVRIFVDGVSRGERSGNPFSITAGPHLITMGDEGSTTMDGVGNVWNTGELGLWTTPPHLVEIPNLDENIAIAFTIGQYIVGEWSYWRADTGFVGTGAVNYIGAMTVTLPGVPVPLIVDGRSLIGSDGTTSYLGTFLSGDRILMQVATGTVTTTWEYWEGGRDDRDVYPNIFSEDVEEDAEDLSTLTFTAAIEGESVDPLAVLVQSDSEVQNAFTGEPVEVTFAEAVAAKLDTSTTTEDGFPVIAIRGRNYSHRVLVTDTLLIEKTVPLDLNEAIVEGYYSCNVRVYLYDEAEHDGEGEFQTSWDTERAWIAFEHGYRIVPDALLATYGDAVSDGDVLLVQGRGILPESETGLVLHSSSLDHDGFTFRVYKPEEDRIYRVICRLG